VNHPNDHQQERQQHVQNFSHGGKSSKTGFDQPQQVFLNSQVVFCLSLMLDSLSVSTHSSSSVAYLKFIEVAEGLELRNGKPFEPVKL
jgi:hypothetical protein